MEGKLMEIQIDAKPIYTIQICDECRKGHMEHDSWHDPGKIMGLHVCSRCEYKATYHQVYPHFGYTYDWADIEETMAELEKTEENS
jgi:hypothetical protein